MTVERTLAIIKPDAWPQRGGEILTMITAAKLEPLDVQALGRGRDYRLPGERFEMLEIFYWEEFYREHAERPFFRSLVEFMAGGPSLVMTLEGEDAIKRWRALMGATDSRKAGAETIRGKFGARMQMRPAPCPASKDGRHVFASGERYLINGWFCTACSRALALIHESDIARDVNYPMWRNAVHGSDSPESAAREIAFFFGAV